jgi:subtilase family serine protease
VIAQGVLVSVLRRGTVVGLLTVVALVAAAAPGPAQAEAGHASRSHRRVCVSAPTGSAACHAQVVADAGSGAALATVAWGGNGYSPSQLQKVYGPFGTGAPLVAVVDAYANPRAASDLNTYRSQFNLGSTTLTQLGQDGRSITPVGGNVGWGQEEMLDLEMVSALCPSCSILYVGARSASFSDLAAAVTTAKSRGAKVISNSYGAAEFSGETNWTQWNIPGVAVTVSSGDGGYGVEFPAASAGVVAVGGTTLTLGPDGTRASETVWSGAGSGCSAYITKPSWQSDAGCGKRTVADVAAVADPNTGVAVYDSYGSKNGANWYVFGGTSVAAPIVGAIFARDGVTTSPAKTLHDNAALLYDVTSGSNGSCTPTYLCTAGSGYDGPTGNGAPNGNPAAF